MARPTPPGKGKPPPGTRSKIRPLDIIIVVLGFIAIIGYNRLSIARLQRSLPNVNNLIVGEWKSTHGPEHLIFRPDKSVSLILVPVPEGSPTAPAAAQPESAAAAPASSSPETPAPVVGKYQLSEAGKIFIQLSDGKKYTTTLTPQARNRFDLIDSYTEGVTTYERLP